MMGYRGRGEYFGWKKLQRKAMANEEWALKAEARKETTKIAGLGYRWVEGDKRFLNEMRSERGNDFCPEPGFVRMGGIESGKAMHENTRDPSKR